MSADRGTHVTRTSVSTMEKKAMSKTEKQGAGLLKENAPVPPHETEIHGAETQARKLASVQVHSDQFYRTMVGRA